MGWLKFLWEERNENVNFSDREMTVVIGILSLVLIVARLFWGVILK